MTNRNFIFAALILFMGTLWLATWWANLISGLLLGFLARHWLQAALTGAIVPLLVWGTAAGLIDYYNQQILSQRLADLMSLPSPFLLVLITGFIGALLGGLSTSTGFLLKNWLRGSAY